MQILKEPILKNRTIYRRYIRQIHHFKVTTFLDNKTNLNRISSKASWLYESYHKELMYQRHEWSGLNSGFWFASQRSGIPRQPLSSPPPTTLMPSIKSEYVSVWHARSTLDCIIIFRQVWWQSCVNYSLKRLRSTSISLTVKMYRMIFNAMGLNLISLEHSLYEVQLCL